MSKNLDEALDLIDEALCAECDDNPPHGTNTDEEMDVGDDDTDS